jgi:DNA-directed RNA polymerase subunit RPC12/RpoP
MTSLYCPSCSSTFHRSRLRDPATCPECGGELREDAPLGPTSDPGCSHAITQWAGRDENGERIYRCAKCGEVVT